MTTVTEMPEGWGISPAPGAPASAWHSVSHHACASTWHFPTRGV